MCPKTESLLHVIVQADSKSNMENILQVTKYDDGVVETVLEDNFENNGLHAYEKCINKNYCHKVELLDKGADGICCEAGIGYYMVFFDGKFLDK